MDPEFTFVHLGIPSILGWGLWFSGFGCFGSCPEGRVSGGTFGTFAPRLLTALTFGVDVLIETHATYPP